MGNVRRRLSEYRLFFREFLTNYHTTGAVLPSGRFLAHALARFVEVGHARRRQILEVGPGTGPVTRRIIAAMGPADELDLVELNESFVGDLRRRLQSDPTFREVADRARILHCGVEELPGRGAYDLIISGLPLNNFAAVEVERILQRLIDLLRPGGTLSFFQYIAIRSARAVISGRAERARLREIGRAMGTVLQKHEIRREWIWPNVPPAWVHHIRV